MLRGNQPRGSAMKSPVVKRSIVIDGHKTSVSLEDAFWSGLKEIASDRKLTLSKLVGDIDSTRVNGNLSSALRLFVLDYYRTSIGSNMSSRSSVAGMAAPAGAMRYPGAALAVSLAGEDSQEGGVRRRSPGREIVSGSRY